MDDNRHANESSEPYSLQGDDDQLVRSFRVLVNQDVRIEMTTGDGPRTWYTLVPTPTGWRTEGYGTGGIHMSFPHFGQ